MTNSVPAVFIAEPPLCVKHRCGHTVYYESHPLTSAKSRLGIIESESKRRCLACVLASEKKR